MVTTLIVRIRAYRLSNKGFKYVDKQNFKYETEFSKDEIPLKKIKRDIEMILYPPNYDRDDALSYLLEPFWDTDENKFTIVNEKAKYARFSTVTTIENISYVCSPFIPLCCNTENHLISEKVISKKEMEKINAIKEQALLDQHLIHTINDNKNEEKPETKTNQTEDDDEDKEGNGQM